MRTSCTASLSLQIEHPKCPRCGAGMGLARGQPVDPAHHQWILECPVCDHTITETVIAPQTPGERDNPPHKQAGHMTAPDQCCATSESSCQGAVHTGPKADMRSAARRGGGRGR